MHKKICNVWGSSMLQLWPKTMFVKFYISCAKSEDINLPVAWLGKCTKAGAVSPIEQSYFDITKITYRGVNAEKSIYVQHRAVDSYYLDYFKNKMSRLEKSRIFYRENDGADQYVIFLSQYYREKLGLKIQESVKSEDDIEINTKWLEIAIPQHVVTKTKYYFFAAWNHPEVGFKVAYSAGFLGLVISIVALILTLLQWSR